VTIRAGTAADVPAILDLGDAVAREGRFIGREFPFDHERVARRTLEAVEDPAHLHLVAEVDRVLVGELTLRPDGRGRVELGMMLSEGARGRGLGTDLLTRAVAWAREQPDLFKMTLDVWPHNTAALALYRKVGFQVEGYLHRHWRRQNGDLWDCVVMGLPLEASSGS
jgi:RimJ/RimL family protein N-acetyltransferase